MDERVSRFSSRGGTRCAQPEKRTIESEREKVAVVESETGDRGRRGCEREGRRGRDEKTERQRESQGTVKSRRPEETRAIGTETNGRTRELAGKTRTRIGTARRKKGGKKRTEGKKGGKKKVKEREREREERARTIGG